jgi:head-tail adaptor
VNFNETIAKSVELDRHLAQSVEKTMAEIGGSTKMLGEIGSLFADVRKAMEDAKLGIAGAASELMVEVKGLEHIQTAIRSETESVRKFKVQLLGNATGGENTPEGT